jgi:altronate hydrolase
MHETVREPRRDAALLLRSGDDIAVARTSLPAGTTIAVDGAEVTLVEPVPAAHKIALHRIAAGDVIHKYGEPIGVATREIAPGEWVHTHNLVHADAPDVGGPSGARTATAATPAAASSRTFEGFRRADGRTGTRNYIAVISTVNCAASTARRIAQALDAEARTLPTVDGAFAVVHPTGCGLPLDGPDHVRLRRTLAGMATHPNVAGYVLVGLGCEVNQTATLISSEQLLDPTSLLGPRPAPPPVVGIQQAGGVARAIEQGIGHGRRLLEQASRARRQPRPLSELVVGLNCGGSDGASGITANPALGLAGDMLVPLGVGWVLAETPETWGAGHILSARAVSSAVASKLAARLRWWEEHTAMHGASVDANPSPGNKEGGLTTIAEKSLGAVAKAGSSPLEAVYDYAEPIQAHGLSFMDTPGLDPVSVTGLVAGGCTLVAFTTGRGSCLGFKPAPVLKIATNSALFRHMEADMDIDAGRAMTGTPLSAVAEAIVEALIATASGRETKSEAQGLGEEEFAPWLTGPTM